MVSWELSHKRVVRYHEKITSIGLEIRKICSRFFLWIKDMSTLRFHHDQNSYYFEEELDVIWTNYKCCTLVGNCKHSVTLKGSNCQMILFHLEALHAVHKKIMDAISLLKFWRWYTISITMSKGGRVVLRLDIINKIRRVYRFQPLVVNCEHGIVEAKK